MDPRYGHNVKFYIILIERSKFIVKKVAKKDDLLVTTPAVHAVYKSGSLQAGLFELPVMLDPPSAENRLSSTDNNHPNGKWVDNKVSNTLLQTFQSYKGLIIALNVQTSFSTETDLHGGVDSCHDSAFP